MSYENSLYILQKSYRYYEIYRYYNITVYRSYISAMPWIYPANR